MEDSVSELYEFHKRCSRQCCWTRELRSFLMSEVQKKAFHPRILEVGCGTGAVYEALYQEFGENAFSYIGVDLSAGKLSFFQRNHKESRVLCCDGALLPFDNRAFDFVFCQYVLLWVFDPVTVLREMKRVTMDGGVCAALAEPDYCRVFAFGGNLPKLAVSQCECLTHRGACIDAGNRLSNWFLAAGFESFTVRNYRNIPIQGIALAEESAWLKKDCCFSETLVLPENAAFSVPTAFAYGRV